jgi:hypothetical protein
VEEAGVPGENHDHGQATGKLYHLRCESSAPFFVICKAGCDAQSIPLTHIYMTAHFPSLAQEHSYR